jgi:hypothetical protein
MRTVLLVLQLRLAALQLLTGYVNRGNSYVHLSEDTVERAVSMGSVTLSNKGLVPAGSNVVNG